MQQLRNNILAFVVLCFAGQAYAQQGYALIRYQMGIPVGDTKNYIDKNSWGGLTLGYRWVPDGDVAVGIDLGWQAFNQTNNYDTYTLGTASVSGIQYRYQNMFNFSGQMEYVMNEGGDFRPYLGLGVGGMYVRRLTSFGLFEVEQDPVQFMMKPSIGFEAYLSNGTALLLGVEYMAGFKDKDLEGQSYLALNLGLLFATN